MDADIVIDGIEVDGGTCSFIGVTGRSTIVVRNAKARDYNGTMIVVNRVDMPEAPAASTFCATQAGAFVGGLIGTRD